MIQITEKLVQLLRSNPRIDASILTSYCRIISMYGDKEDAAALFRIFTEQPSDYRRALLLAPVMRCGDLALAEEIDRFCFEQGRLKEGIPSEVLHVLGYMGYEKYIDYMVDCICTNDWYLSKDACLGLLHLPCESHREKLENELEKVYGQPLFPEFLPALSFKFANAQIIPRLLAWGEQASTDCNAGLILGISMFGHTQKEQIKYILLEPFWEMYSIGTGSHWWGYMSMQMVELTFSELISALKDQTPVVQEHAECIPDKRTLEHRFHVLHDLLELKLIDDPNPVRFAPLNQESVIELYKELFQWSNEHKDDSVTGRINTYFEYDHPLMEKYMQLRIRMEMGIKQELELQAWASSGKINM
ncbi:hypothetical protein [Aneurinibacillus aneurinilyticus]|uniref:Uncharacterized protein n=1 Tax=Aneurinibacillus aneurinilyticus TaxID=1391 RepID=A0A848D2M0_ANEAE|nr:hypothetical protein [Aneurinibacillus aneurinilyticus]NMF00207.1 hypothetical protein [Aneurinibacillus aneurinilyticus]